MAGDLVRSPAAPVPGGGDGHRDDGARGTGAVGAAAATVSGAAEPAAGLFQGDTGRLPLETRRVLVQLLAGPFLDGRRHTGQWSVLLRDEAVIRSRLCELFLDLVVDRDLQVAFTRQAETGDLDAPILLRRVPLTFLESALLLHLRHLVTQADARGERAVVSADELRDHLAVYEQAASTDRAGFAKRVEACIEKMKRNNILRKLRASEDRFEISPALKIVFAAEQVAHLTRVYQEAARADGAAEAAAAGGDGAAEPEEGAGEEDGDP